MSGAVLAVAFRDHMALYATLAAAAALLTVVLVTVAPAVWSRSPERRAAAMAVLDRLLGRHG